MHLATRLVKAEVGGECRFIAELEEGRYLVSSAPEVSNSDNNDIQAVDGVRFFLVENESVREANENEIRLGHHPTFMKHIRDLESDDHTINELLEKYRFQQTGVIMNHHDSSDEDERLAMRKYVDWVNDGKPTGIWSNQEFYAIQRGYFGRIVYDLE